MSSRNGFLSRNVVAFRDIYIAGESRTSNGSEYVSSVQTIDHDQVEQMVTPCGDVVDPAQVAKTAGLRYVSDTMPGIRRKNMLLLYATGDWQR